MFFNSSKKNCVILGLKFLMQCVNSAVLLLTLECTFNAREGCRDSRLELCDKCLIRRGGRQLELSKHKAFVVLQLLIFFRNFFISVFERPGVLHQATTIGSLRVGRSLSSLGEFKSMQKRGPSWIR